jgi:hypothetical protein
VHKDLHEYAKHYESKEDLALALLGEGAKLIEKILFDEGELLSTIEIIPDQLPENGYHISWWTPDTCYGDNEEE